MLGMRSATVRAWIKSKKSSGPVFRRDYDELEGGEVLLSFQDLIELWVVGQLRRRGMPLQRIHKATPPMADSPMGFGQLAPYTGERPATDSVT